MPSLHVLPQPISPALRTSVALSAHSSGQSTRRGSRPEIPAGTQNSAENSTVPPTTSRRATCVFLLQTSSAQPASNTGRHFLHAPRNSPPCNGADLLSKIPLRPQIPAFHARFPRIALRSF